MMMCIKTVYFYIITIEYIFHHVSWYITIYCKDLEPFVKAMYRKLEPFILVLTHQVSSSSKIAINAPIFMI